MAATTVLKLLLEEQKNLSSTIADKESGSLEEKIVVDSIENNNREDITPKSNSLSNSTNLLVQGTHISNTTEVSVTTNVPNKILLVTYTTRASAELAMAEGLSLFDQGTKLNLTWHNNNMTNNNN